MVFLRREIFRLLFFLNFTIFATSYGKKSIFLFSKLHRLNGWLIPFFSIFFIGFFRVAEMLIFGANYILQIFTIHISYAENHQFV